MEQIEQLRQEVMKIKQKCSTLDDESELFLVYHREIIALREEITALIRNDTSVRESRGIKRKHGYSLEGMMYYCRGPIWLLLGQHTLTPK